MSEHNKVIWSEGMLLFPQHFQQHDRYLERWVNDRCLGLQPYDWGFYTLTLDLDLLKSGKLALVQCQGILPDGTPFHLPENDDTPLPLDIPEDSQDELVFLGLPVRRTQSVEVDSEANPETLARFRLREHEVRDVSGVAEGKTALHVGQLKTRLFLEREERSGYTCLGVARVVEARSDKNVILDDHYIPATLNCLDSLRLSGLLKELHGLLNTRGEALASRVAAAGHGGVSEVADFLLLQLVNRYQALFEHFSRVAGLHPETFYRFAIQLAGEMATFFRPEKRPPRFPAYDHGHLQATFAPLMEALRELLAMVSTPQAIPIPLSKPQYGIYGAKIPDLTLLDSAMFVLAANAQVVPETLRGSFPPQVKIGPVEKIRDLIRLQLPGISIHPLPVAPRQIPYHAGFTYFELNKRSELWEEMATSGGFAIHISGSFPGLELEFWAIRKE